ncbi:MAG: crosslink repair DNA glycosylase YcaQ family protein [Kiloniellales bacterium]|nr:crosslink repair DNA glycosylase YcaQ family protein [Kiloniellales bacterium]
MSLPVIRNAEARRLILARQGLADPPNRKLTKDGLLDLIARLGYVQVDSIQTLERAHHQILFSRNQTYRHRLLARLLEREAALFENWTHDAAIIPSDFYPYWRRRFERERTRLLERWRQWRREGFEEAMDGVLAQVRDRGPTRARDLGPSNDSGGDPGGAPGEGKTKGGTGWWDWHPEKTALEFLWRTGELAVARREGFQKVYDLAERVIPACHRDEAPSHEASIDWACRGALERLGFATHGELAAFWDAVTPAEAARWCRGRPDSELVEAEVEAVAGGKPRKVYTTREVLAGLGDLPEPPKRLRALSPFDPVLRDRARAERIFGLDYRIEVFVPEARRRYGYYVFPLLEGARFVGRIDMKHDRATGRLAVKGLWPEPRCRWGRGRRDALEAELERLRRFTGAERVAFEDGYLRSD